MKKIKSTLCLILVFVMICGLALPISSLADSPANVNVSITKVQDGVYKLAYIASADKGVMEAGLVLSFDNTMIDPADTKNYTVYTLNDGANQDGKLGYCMNNPVKDDRDDKIYTAAAALYINGERSAINCGVACSAAKAYIPTDTVMFELYFKLKDGVTEADLNKTSFVIESTTGEGTFLKRATRDYGVYLKCGDGTVYGKDAPTNTLPVTLTYPNSNYDKFTGTAIDKTSLSVAVPTEAEYTAGTGTHPKTLPLAVNNTGLDGAYAPAAAQHAPATTTWSITTDPAPAGVTIDTNTGLLSVDNTAQTGTVEVTASTVANGVTKTDSATVTVTRAEAVLTSVALDKESIIVAGGKSSQTVIATAYDQFGAPYTAGLDWSISGVNGVEWERRLSITPNTDDTSKATVTVFNYARVGHYNITASPTTGEAKSATLAVTRNGESIPAKVEITEPVGLITDVPEATADPVTNYFQAKVYDQYEENISGTSIIAWTVSPENEGVSIEAYATDSATGILTITSSAKAIEYTVTATCGEASDNYKFTAVKKAQVATSVAVSGGVTEMTVPGTGTNTATTAFTATVYDQYGVAMTEQPTVTWSIKDGNGKAVSGVVIGLDGKVTVDANAKTSITDTTGKDFTVTATVGTGEAAKSGSAATPVTVKRAASVATSVEVSGGVSEMLIPGTNETDKVADTAFTATVYDQYGAAMSDQTVTWSIKDGESTVDSVTIGTDGKVTVTADAAEIITGATAKDFTVTATVGTAVSDTAIVAVKRDTQKATSIKMFKTVKGTETEITGTGDTIVVPMTTGAAAAEVTYSGKVYDQYGELMSETAAVTQSGNLPDGTSFAAAAGKVTVDPNTDPKADNLGSFKVTVSSPSVSTVKMEATVSIVKLNADWSGVTAKTGLKYGVKNSETLDGLSATTMPYTLDGKTASLTGAYTVTDSDSVQGATSGTETRDVTVTFTADDSVGNGDYKSLTLQKTYTITIAPRPVTVTVTSATKVYGENPVTLTATLKDGSALVGTDSIDGLGLGLTSTGNTTTAAKGTYAVTGDGDYNANYAVTIEGGDNAFTVTAKTLTVTVGDYAITKVYDGTTNPGKPAGKLGLDGVVNKDVISISDGTVGDYASANAGENKTVQITGLSLLGDKKDNYSINSTFSFGKAAITTKPLSEVTIADIAAQNYTGKQIKPVPVVSFDNNGDAEGGVITLNMTTDFTCDYGENTNCATGGSVTITAAENGNYSGSQKKTFTISPITTTLTIKDSFSGKVYDGTAIAAPTAEQIETNATGATPSYTYYSKQACAEADKLSAAPKNAGTYYVKGHIDASDNCTEATSDAASFKILARDVSGAAVATVASQEYNGADYKPALTVSFTDPSLSLTATTDYTVEYSDNKDVGTGSAKITGIVNYTGTKTVNFDITAKEVGLTWNDYTGLVYDGKAKNVTASATDLVDPDACIVTVTGGTQTDAGTYTATATSLDNTNYKLPTAKTQEYTIAQASRNLTLDASTKTISGSFSLVPTYNNADNSAVVTYTSNQPSIATVDSNGIVTAVGNGTATITVSIAGTKNYTKDSATCTVTSVAHPVTGASASSDYASDSLSATVTGQTIKVTGFVTAGKTITVTPTLTSGASAADLTATITATDETLKAGAQYTVTVGGKEIVYTIDTSAVTLKPATVKVEQETELKIAAPAPSQTITDVDVEGVAEAVSGTVIAEAQAKAGELTPDDENTLGGAENVIIVADVKTEVNVTNIDNNQVELTVTPIVTYTATSKAAGNNEKIPFEGEENIEAALGQNVITVSLTAGRDLFDANANIIAQHTLNNNSFEYRNVKYEGGAYKWTQHGASPVVLKTVNKQSITINFMQYGKNAIDITNVYDVEAINTEKGNFPTPPAVTGYTFNGWDVAGSKGVTKLTKDIFDAIARTGAPADATPVYTQNPAPNTGNGGGDRANTFTITATAGVGGTITPSGRVSVSEGANKTFAIKANDGYTISGILVDGEAVTVANTYTFSKVVKNHTIAVSFEKDNTQTDTPSTDVLARFTDVNGHWAKDAIRYMVENKYMDGTSYTTFEPDTQMNRAMIVKILYNIEGAPAVTSAAPFSDVAAGQWYTDAIAWASTNNIVNGVGAGRYDPMKTVTRQELAAILYRYAQFKGADVTGTADLSGFTDAGAVAAWAQTSVGWAVSESIISGRTATTIVPQGTATRGEVATMLMRYLTK